METPIPKSDVLHKNDDIPSWAFNKNFVRPKEFDTKILVYLDIERLRMKVIPGRDPVRYPPYVRYMTPFERHRFTMKCTYCHQTSPISYNSLRDKLNSIDMYQTLNARYINHFPYHRYPFVTCPKCKRVILFPRWMQLIDRVRYVPTLLEGALEIGWMDMRNNYKDWEADGDHPLTEDDFYWIADIALNEAYPCCWFPYTNKYLRELKIEYIRVGEMKISTNDYHRLFTHVFDDVHNSGSGTVRRSTKPSRRRKH